MTSYPRDNNTLLDNGGYRIVVHNITLMDEFFHPKAKDNQIAKDDEFTRNIES